MVRSDVFHGIFRALAVVLGLTTDACSVGLFMSCATVFAGGTRHWFMGPYKTLYNRYVRWTRAGVFSAIFETLAAEAGAPDRIMIDATHLKAHRTSASLLQKKGGLAASDAPKAV